MPSPLVDIGVNLTNPVFEHDCDAIIARAHAAGVTTLVLTGSDINDSHAAAELAARYPGCFSTAGIHPHHAKEFNAHSGDQLRQLTRLPQVKAIGETGLDFNRNYSPQPQQLTAFEAHLELAAELQLPLFLHQRDAHADFYQRVKSCRNVICDAVVHCFTGNKEELFAYLDLGLYIGITGWICDERRGGHLQEIINNIPSDRLLLESDAPYLLPRTIKPKPRSRRNEPAFMPHILAAVSQCLEKSEHDIAFATTANARRFFRLD